jgi:hypothetical protein
MPQTRSTAPSTVLSSVPRPGLPPVPVAIFLPPPHVSAATGPAADAVSGYADWCGVSARELAGLIASYTRPTDLVGDLDDHPTIARAAGYLDRHHVRLHTGGQHEAAGSGRVARPQAQPRAALILARLPQADVDSLDLHDLTRAMHTWRTLLRPGGYLLVAVTALGSPDGRVSQRATAIAAARTAGLSWQQEFLVVTAPLAEYEPRATPDAAGTTPAVLLNGRHQPAHVKLLALQHRTGGDDNA